MNIMKKQQKIDFINEINDKFVNARNHGHIGDNWWYPVQNRIAYDVKMRSYADVDSFRKHLTKLQNDMLSDEQIAYILQDDLYENARMLSEDITNDFGLDNGFSGRSGGWIEVDYNNNLPSEDEILQYYNNKEDIEMFYQQAKELDELENKVKNFIEDRHKSLNNYIDSPEYYKELKEILIDNEVIKEDNDILHDKKMSTPLKDLLTHQNETVRRHAQGINKTI